MKTEKKTKDPCFATVKREKKTRRHPDKSGLSTPRVENAGESRTQPESFKNSCVVLSGLGA